MRKIEFIAPVAAMRGNLSGDQKLLYPTKNNSAWEAPQGQRSAATNYQPRYIGAKRAFNDLKTFSTRTRSSVNITPAMRTNMALLASVNDITNKAMQNMLIQSQLVALAQQYKPAEWTFKHWLSSIIRQAIIDKRNSIIFDPKGTPDPAVNNPFTVGIDSNARASNINPEIFFKFFTLLGRDGSVILNIPVVGSSDVQATVVNGITFGDIFVQPGISFYGTSQFTRIYQNGKQSPYLLNWAMYGSEPDKPVQAETDDPSVMYNLLRRAKDSEDTWVQVTSVMECDTETYEYQLQLNA